MCHWDFLLLPNLVAFPGQSQPPESRPTQYSNYSWRWWISDSLLPGDVSSESSWLSFTPVVHPVKTSQPTVQTKTLNNAANHSSISTDQNVTMPVLSSNYACLVVKLRLSCHQTMLVLSLPMPVLSPSMPVLSPDYACLVTTHACLVTTHPCLVTKLCLYYHQTMPVFLPLPVHTFC